MNPDQNQTRQPKAIIYCRVSGRSQLKGDGLNSQEFRCRQYAEERGLHVAAVFPDSVSGRGDFMHRPGMVALLAYLDEMAGEPHVVIFDDLKRFARDTEFHLNLRRILKSRNASVECLNFRFEDTPEGEFIETVIAAQGELDRKQIARQSRQKSEARLHQGYWVFQAPIGYRYVSAKGGGKVLARDEPVATLIEDVLNNYAAGHFRSIAEIQRHFEGLPEFPKDTPAGGVRTQKVIRILENPLYAGQIDAKCWGIKAAGKHSPLITLETHLRIQHRMKERSFTKTRKDTSAAFPLRGAVVCASCQTPLTGGWAQGKYNRFAYYWCRNSECELKGKTIPRAKIEGEFAEILSTLRPTKPIISIFKQMLRHRWDEVEADVEKRQAGLLKEAGEAEVEIEKLVSRIVETTNDRVAAAYEKRIEELQVQKDVLSQKAARIRTSAMPFDGLFELSMRFLGDPKKLWHSGDLTLRRLLIRLCFSQCVQYARGKGFEHPALAAPFNIIKELGQKMSTNKRDFDAACKMVPLA